MKRPIQRSYQMPFHQRCTQLYEHIALSSNRTQCFKARSSKQMSQRAQCHCQLSTLNVGTLLVLQKLHFHGLDMHPIVILCAPQAVPPVRFPYLPKRLCIGLCQTRARCVPAQLIAFGVKINRQSISVHRP